MGNPTSTSKTTVHICGGGEIVRGAWTVTGSRLWPGVRKGYTDFDHEPMSPFPATCTVECHGPVGNPGLPSSSQHYQLQSATHTEGTFIHCREDQLGNLVIR